ncbi:hypothetical protein M0805_005727 [Coniferiporia weirii]|nr:hypothetical protein M0805_005727 [Coniferiporia weirii]
MDSPARRRPLDIPKPAAEAGLAEWTSRIKAIQREVDADEEAEQRSLEEEIRASRLARSRRSGGAQAFAPADRERLRSSSPVAQVSPPPRTTTTTTTTTVGQGHDRHANLVDTLHKLTGEPPSPAPAAAAVLPSAQAERKAKAPAVPPGKPTEPMSLAAFMGGRATGPRLNRPAPQPDAHDPTLFVQRTRADIDAPHPVFGRGGIALAGLAGKGREVVHARSSGEEQSSVAPIPAPAPAPATPAKNWARERTVSTPAPYVPQPAPKSVDRSPPVISHGGQGVRNRVESLYANANRSTERVTTPSVVRGMKSTEKLVQRPVAPAKPDTLRRPPSSIEPPNRASSSPVPSAATPSPRSQTPSAPVASRPLSTSPPITVPSLSRPAQPQIRPTSAGPQIPASGRPAPAFLKPPQQKDLTPSLSRLQGRGFVQSFVKLSSELEAASSPAGGSPERATGVTVSVQPKKASVLDRWNPPRGSPSPSPVSAPPIRKAKTMDAFSARSELSPSPEPKRSASPPKAKSYAGSSSRPRSVHGDSLPLGSSNTLFSYIKPTKTGDAPATNAPEPPQQRSKTPSKQVNYDYGASSDELGVRTRSRSNSSSAKTAATAPSTRAKADLAFEPSTRPLSHPTKDRAKVRRKGAGAPTQSTTGPTSVTETTSEATADEARQGALDTTTFALETERPTVLSTQNVSSPVEEVASFTTVPSQESRPAVTQARGEKVRRLQDSWANQAPISAKPVRKLPLVAPSPTRTSFSPASSNIKAGKVALPGLASANTTAVPPLSPPLTPPLTVRGEIENQPPPSPGRHSRIPSTGSRPTVMDVAQAFNTGGATSPPPTSLSFPRSPISPSYEDRDPGRWGEAESERTITPAIIKAERRRSNYEKYASFTLPVLPEEKTPASSPAGTLKGVDAAAVADYARLSTLGAEGGRRIEEPPSTRTLDAARPKAQIDVASTEALPVINAAKLWDAHLRAYGPDADMHTVSVDVLCVDGASAVEITRDTGGSGAFVFYDSEVLAVVHRAKSRASGLVATKVWAWQGRRCAAGEQEEKKVLELAKRYGTTVVTCEQCCEPQELVHVLGGSLVVRQGKRSLWSAENTTMHRVRSWAGLLLIDEVDMNIRNLCSGFSYCISVLDTLWVWYGCGSALAERSAALRYAQTLVSPSEKDIVEVEEGQEDEMFWMFLGDEGYAHADYWKWRKGEKGADPRVWRVDCMRSGSEVKELETPPSVAEVRSAVLVLHLAYEIFVLVGSSAREQRRDIKLGLTLAQELSSHTARSKPLRPPVHVLLFPSHIPLDLRAAVRGLDDEAIHGSEAPDQMNLLPLDAAWARVG